MLTDVAIRKAKPAAKVRKLWDAHGLYLLLMPNGVRGWRFRYHFGGREKLMSLGPYPLVKLERARHERDEARLLIRDGIDPARARKRAKDTGGHLFRDVGERWFAKAHRDSARSTRTKVRWILDRCLKPLANRPIAGLEPPDVLAAIEPIDHRGQHETAHRTLETCGQIFRFAVASGLATRDMAADVRGALSPVRVVHHPAVTDPIAVGTLLRAIESLPPHTTVGVAMRLAPYLFVRPGELRAMEWGELDLTAALWHLPAAKMKLRRDHLVPLPAQAIALLTARQTTAASGRYVFPSPRTRARPLSNNALNAALRQLGYGTDEATAHGWRSTARTLIDEQLRCPPQAIEIQLAHRMPGAMGDTYNRALYLEERTAMMQKYADYLDHLRAAR